MKSYLKKTYYLDYNSANIKRKTDEILAGLPESSDVAKSIALFYFVRDEIKYVAKLNPKFYNRKSTKASRTLDRGFGYCIQKATLMASMARYAGIPSRLHFVDMKNHLTPREFIDRMGSDKFIYHAYPELFLNGKWVEANVAFDKELCKRKNFPIVDFDGINPGLFAKMDENGNRFVEYTKDHGVFKDVPYYKIVLAWLKAYDHVHIINGHKKTKKKE